MHSRLVIARNPASPVITSQPIAMPRSCTDRAGRDVQLHDLHRSAVLVSPAEYLPVLNAARTCHMYIAHGHDARAEGDVAFDLEPAAAAQ